MALTLVLLELTVMYPGSCSGSTIPVPKVLFCIFDKLENETQKFMKFICFYLNMKKEIQITDHYFHV